MRQQREKIERKKRRNGWGKSIKMQNRSNNKYCTGSTGWWEDQVAAKKTTTWPLLANHYCLVIGLSERREGKWEIWCEWLCRVVLSFWLSFLFAWRIRHGRGRESADKFTTTTTTNERRGEKRSSVEGGGKLTGEKVGEWLEQQHQHQQQHVRWGQAWWSWAEDGTVGTLVRAADMTHAQVVQILHIEQWLVEALCIDGQKGKGREKSN